MQWLDNHHCQDDPWHLVLIFLATFTFLTVVSYTLTEEMLFLDDNNLVFQKLLATGHNKRVINVFKSSL